VALSVGRISTVADRSVCDGLDLNDSGRINPG
jgi:hypothetical protein